MKPEQQPETVSLQTITSAVANLKNRLQCDYEQSYPELREIIHIVLDEGEANAWDLSSFPHLLLPDLVEAHIATLGLQPPAARHNTVFAPRNLNEIHTSQPVFALCGS